MTDEFADALLNKRRNKVRKFDECVYWDYKEFFDISTPLKLCEVAKDLLAFHNSEGGALIFGVTDSFSAKGISQRELDQSDLLRSKLQSFFSTPLPLFLDRIEISNNNILLIVFVKKASADAVSFSRNGADQKPGKPLFLKGDVFYRFNDETRRVLDEVDRQRMAAQLSYSNIEAYLLDVDDEYFRLLSPNYDRFFGRLDLIDEIRDALTLRHPIVALDGQGGVGKTALAIRAMRAIYEEVSMDFIVSISAKSSVWVGKSAPVKSSFSGLQGLLEILANSLCIDICEDSDRLKSQLIEFMAGLNGIILIDNAEDIIHQDVFDFLSKDVPDPVKILITTRIDKGYGGYVISVPEMDDESSKALLVHELTRSGVDDVDGDPYLNAILSETGNVPLAIKWAAMIVSQKGSCKSAAREIAQAGINKSEFLSFCFENMFSSLSDTAKSCAMLIPFLGESWRWHTLQIALDLELDDIRCAVHDISDAGLISQVRSNGDFKYHVLPLARQFLTGKLKRQTELESAARDRIFDAFSSSDESMLQEWPDDKLAALSLECAEEKALCGDFRKSIQLAQLSRNVKPCSKAVFIEGYSKYGDGQADQGIALMKRAFSEDEFVEDARQEYRVWFTKSVFTSGTVYDQNNSIDVNIGYLPAYFNLLEGAAASVVENLIARGRNSDLIEVLGAIDDPDDIELCADILIRHRQNFRIWNVDKRKSDKIKSLVETVRGVGIMSAGVEVVYKM